MIYRLLKRGFDIFASLLALIVLFPLFLVICIGIKLSSKGPVFYKSQRIGRDRRLITVHKFRSMHVRQAGTVESRFLVNDNRIFRFGRFLRKSKLDELPQLLDIVQGRMSIVGPRPYPKSFVDKHYIREYATILSVRPGLACFDSLYDYAHGDLFVTDEREYANKVLPVRTELAKMYIENKNIITDLYCIFRTLQLIFQIIILKKKEFSLTGYERIATNRVEERTVVE